MSKIRTFFQHIPNILTFFNILLGTGAVVLSIEKQNISYSCYFVMAAVAIHLITSMQKNAKDIRKELNSLAAVISLGIAPSVILFRLLKKALRIREVTGHTSIVNLIILFSAFLVAVFVALRIARTLTHGTERLENNRRVGLPLAAYALLIASLPLIDHFDTEDLLLFSTMESNLYFIGSIIVIKTSIRNIYFLLPIILFSLLIVLRFPMFSLRFSSANFGENKTRYLFFFLTTILLMMYQVLAVPFVVVLYILISALNNVARLDRRSTARVYYSDLKKPFGESFSH